MSNDDSKPTTKHCYPKPQAEYQEIIQNPDVFVEKLQSFHLFYGNKLRVPKLGGTLLDLHQLFLEVTTRGGLEKVIKDRRWREVTGAFNFPSSITSASFVLRKYYLSLLYHFEQVYYFRKEEPSVVSADQQSKISNGSMLPQGVDGGAVLDEIFASHDLEDGSLVNGTIDGKFDDGYLVSVNLGSEVLKGVLYFAPVETTKVSQTISTPAIKPAQRSRRKRQLATMDPSHPKRNRSGYTFFYAEQYPILRPSYRGQERAIRSKAISTRIGELWGTLTDVEKQVYQEKGRQDKERYKAEMIEYKHVQGGHQ